MIKGSLIATLDIECGESCSRGKCIDSTNSSMASDGWIESAQEGLKYVVETSGDQPAGYWLAESAKTKREMRGGGTSFSMGAPH